MSINTALLFLIAVVMATTVNCQQQHMESPCPTLFHYEPSPSNENDRWYGVLTLLSDSELNGVWLRLILDKPSLQLGTWFGGEISTTDHIEYLVKQPQHKLKPFQPTYVRFFIRYDATQAPPKLVAFRLNAKTVCPISDSTTAEPSTSAQLITSAVLPSSTTTVLPPQPQQQSNQGGDDSDSITFENSQTQYQIFTNHGATQTVHLKVECGVVKVKARPLITHAEATYPGEFPWHAALYEYETDSSGRRASSATYICGGSLITANYVLTVAHCVVLRTGSKDPSVLKIYLGKYKLSDSKRTNDKIQEKQVSRIIVHPDHDLDTLKQDIALLRLSTSASITDHVRTVCLWDRRRAQLDQVVGKLGTLVGWGFDGSGRPSDVLGKARVPVVAQETCIFSNPDFYAQFTSNRTYCAGFRNGTSACNGDSGGGMVFPQVSPNGAVKWRLRGMVSLSVALPEESRCDPSQYVVFTDAAQFIEWVVTKVKSNA